MKNGKRTWWLLAVTSTVEKWVAVLVSLYTMSSACAVDFMDLQQKRVKF